MFAQGTLEFRNYLFLNIAARNDWSSTLEDGNNSILYPSISLAYDMTSGIAALQNLSALDFLKARVSYGTSAGFPAPYRTRNYLSVVGKDFVTPAGASLSSISIDDNLGNLDLKPESIAEIEFGIESNWLNNRLGLNITYFSKTVTDLIVDKSLDPSTGYRRTLINAGDMKVEGLELDISATIPLPVDGLRWTINGIYTLMNPQ